MGQSVDELLKELTLEEKCSLLSGETFNDSQSVPRLGIEKMLMTDGPHGLRKQSDKPDHLGMNVSVPATCFPPACALGSSWNREIVYKMGEALASECRAENVAVILGPGNNIKRSPLCGRNFEYFSEDPYLASNLAAQHIKGVQSKGVGASLKHFAVNNQETKRLTLNATVDERTLREIYLTSFETAVKEGKPWTVMCAYNRLNGEFGSENKYLLNDILREEWGYDGLVVTDWGAANDRVKGLIAGQDLEMPSSGTVNDSKVEAAVKDGSLPVEYVDRAVRRLLELREKLHAAGEAEPVSYEKNHRIAEEIAEECIVLLKNEDKVLPLKAEDKVVVIGEFAEKPRFQGGGSSHINTTFLDKPLEELIIHPRLQKDYYKNTPRMEAFGKAFQNAAGPVCYNGDIFTTADYEKLTARFPELNCIMMGRGVLGNPALAREIRGGCSAEKSEIRKFHDRMYAEYCQDLSGDRNILFRMKELWFYLAPLFTNYKKYAKKIRKAEKCTVYESAVNELFSCEELTAGGGIRELL